MTDERHRPMTIADLRAELGMTMDQFAERIGLANRSNVSVIERANRCGLKVALRIEQLSRGRVDAATINEDVALSRAACLGGCEAVSAVHAGDDASTGVIASTGNAAANSPAIAQGVAA